MFHSKTRGFFHQPLQLAGSAAAPPALPELTPDRAACRAAGAVSLRSTPPFTPFAFAHLRSGPPSYDAEGGTGSGHPATFALTGSISGINRKSVSSLGKKGETTITWTADRRGPGRLLLPFRRGPGRPRRPPPARPVQGPSLRRHPLAGGGMSPCAAPSRSYPLTLPFGLRAGRPEPSRLGEKIDL